MGTTMMVVFLELKVSFEFFFSYWKQYSDLHSITASCYNGTHDLVISQNLEQDYLAITAFCYNGTQKKVFTSNCVTSQKNVFVSSLFSTTTVQLTLCFFFQHLPFFWFCMICFLFANTKHKVSLLVFWNKQTMNKVSLNFAWASVRVLVLSIDEKVFEKNNTTTSVLQSKKEF